MKRNYLSASALKAFAKSPNHYLQYVSGERTESDALSRCVLKLAGMYKLNVYGEDEVDTKDPGQ